METEELQIGRGVHHGHNIRRTRVEKDIKQEAMAQLVHLSQPAISKYEKMSVIDDEMLQRFARALDVPVDYLKTLEENAPSIVFESITNDIHDNTDVTSVGLIENDNRTNYFNPLDKITELYERLLKEKDERYATLEARIQKLEEKK